MSSILEVTAYENVSTHMIHLVGTFPSPRRTGATQCGQLLDDMKMLAQPLNEVPQHALCRKCMQLLGLVRFD